MKASASIPRMRQLGRERSLCDPVHAMHGTPAADRPPARHVDALMLRGAAAELLAMASHFKSAAERLGPP